MIKLLTRPPTPTLSSKFLLATIWKALFLGSRLYHGSEHSARVQGKSTLAVHLHGKGHWRHRSQYYLNVVDANQGRRPRV
ncbi:hypothetical protein WG66_000808 [Moniliophthora roreri]|nr:hypothetical protein WG66_000808 [Moniliophthora roreri]